MKTIIITFLLLFSIVTFAQDEEVRPGNGQCNGHYVGDGHPSFHPCHLDDPAQVPINDELFILGSIILIGSFAFLKLKK